MSAEPPGFAVHVVDDEEVLRDSLAFLFASRGIATRLWPSGEAFLAAWPQSDCGCIILDVRMEGMTGPQLVDALMQAEGGGAALPPVIFLTGHADVPLAVQTLKGGAFDFLEKPFNDNQIVELALRAMDLHQSRATESTSRADLVARFASLSAREVDVMQLILEGQLNKQIADRLGISVRTVEVHRARVLQKTGARNSVELARLQARLE
ncbi:response regulator transcription factor [Rhodobacter sp. HX-7-19]|uniref:Response regulator transcription factor n=1 Tax=Paragemmobacter kunshanensis TaxID=2583234 RepID=A0A6M1TQU6_9RHOB|nr:response regulator [Rhodobacter kunshanensis]NGQ92659.1 response regulator transcription factor [Rhodobacter kunshanensis]